MSKELEERALKDIVGLHIDSDGSLCPSDDDTSGEAWSEAETTTRRSPLTSYDIDTMFTIIKGRDNHRWSLGNIRHQWKLFSDTDNTMRKQLSRYEIFPNLVFKLKLNPVED